jgi:hypothetical protein
MELTFVDKVAIIMTFIISWWLIQKLSGRRRD